MFFHEYPVETILGYAEASGLDAVEFWLETPHFWLRGMPDEELRQALAAHPALELATVHAPILDLNPCSINPRVAEVSVAYALEAVAFAERFGAEVVTVHPGRRTAKRPPSPDDYRRFDRLIGALREAASGVGVRVAIENMERKVNNFLSSPDAARRLLDQEDWLWFTLDVSHAMGTSLAEVGEFIELCGDRLANVHLSRASDGKMHLALSGHPDGRAVLEMLRNARYDGPITLELEDLRLDRSYSADEKTGLIASECAFIRSVLG
jgi:sugar phosphate isomerase/epimerase